MANNQITMPTPEYHTDAPSPQSAEPIAAFKMFDAYPWSLDKLFVFGLSDALGRLSPGYDLERALGITLQRRIERYKAQHNIDIDRPAYEHYAAHLPDDLRPDRRLVTMVEVIQRDIEEELQRHVKQKPQQSEAAVNGPKSVGKSVLTVPPWQAQAPMVDTRQKAEKDSDVYEAGVTGKAGIEAPYPNRFQAVMEAVTLGMPVSGIKEIPNTLARQPGISPIGKMQAPKKPWEKQASTICAADQRSGPQTEYFLDPEFPPLEGDEAQGR